MFNDGYARSECDMVCANSFFVIFEECQDFTSSDFALFWRLCQGGGDLFLAGDTAQSVEQGIAFRFEDVKRVFYEMKKEDLSMGIPESPLTIQINFRSHSGVLEVAADVLKILHEAFPGAANKLQGDQGLFKGPRPCLLNRRGEKSLDHDALCDIVSKNPSLVVLTPDENTAALKERLGTVSEGLVVLGICEAKGLDFDEVVIVDFFSTASERLSKAWKALFRTANNSKNLDSDFHDTYPELESKFGLSIYSSSYRSLACFLGFFCFQSFSQHSSSLSQCDSSSYTLPLLAAVTAYFSSKQLNLKFVKVFLGGFYIRAWQRSRMSQISQSS